MINAIIIDDEEIALKSLCGKINTHCREIKILKLFTKPEEALKEMEELNPDLVFLDIEMPQMNGFELLQQLPEINFELIFTTSYDQYAIKAIRFSALDYLLKPIDREELQKAVQKVSQRLAHPVSQQIEILLKKIHQPATAINKIALPTMEGLQMVPLDSIISCASDGNYTIFFLKNNKKVIASRILKEIEEMLEDYTFTRVHNSYIVNINEIEKYILTLKNLKNEPMRE